MIAQGQRLRYIPAEPEPAIVGPVRAQTEQGGEERAAGKGDAPLWAHGVMGLAVLCVAAMGWAIYEAQTSRWQSEHFAERAAELSYDVERGRSPAVVDAPRGPHDRRVGHVELPMFNERLEAQGLRLTHQARVSPIFRELVEEGIFPIYRVKDQTGLRIRDAQRRRVYSFDYPRRVFESFEEIPELIVETLLFIENRNLLDPDFPRANPAVDFRRVLRAIIDQSLYMLGSERDVPGGSTLATQMEKFRHSPAGRTETIGEKWQQMLSASYRAYLDGPETRASSQRVVKDYVNSVPLGARAGWGEVHGLGDGLLAWFGSDLDEVNEALRSRPNPGDSEAFAAYGRAYRMVLSLILAQQRPTVFLPKNIDALNERSAMFLRVLAREGVIDEKLRDEALAWPVELVELVPQVPVEAQLDEKTLDGLQAGLTSLLGLERRYDLIRLDLEVETSLDVEAQEAVRERLEKLADPAFIKSAGLRGRTRIGHGDPEEIVYGFTLYERGADGHRLRVQVDTHDSQMDLNAASKLDLGSTAKLRTLTHYLEVIEALYEELGVLSAEERADLEVHREDRLTHWAITYLRRNPDATVEEMLEASMSRRYSADPHQSFWTGGGRHRFGNASRRHNGAVLDVWRAFRESANLPFVRMMSDIVHYHIGRLPDDVARVLDDRRDPRREELLMRFAGRDAEKFVGRFYAGFHGREADEVLERVLRGQRRTLTNDAIIFRHVLPGADVEAFGEFMATRGRRLGEARLQQLFDAHGPGEDELFERRTRHDINPLELWVARFVLENPEASRAEVMVASEGVREDALEWLLWTETALEQRRRIYYVLEEEAFEKISTAWQEVGYPFDKLVPSYATALGSSADRPSALAELVGIVLSEGRRLPLVRFEALHFAEGTPFEVRHEYGGNAGREVLSPEVARVVRRAMEAVVSHGTGRPLRAGLVSSDGQGLKIAGKTGTADHRFHFYDRRGRITGSRAVNRTATWVFSVGDCHFGTIVAFVPDEKADDHTFMSALAVRILRVLEPAIAPLLEDAGTCH